MIQLITKSEKFFKNRCYFDAIGKNYWKNKMSFKRYQKLLDKTLSTQNDITYDASISKEVFTTTQEDYNRVSWGVIVVTDETHPQYFV